ncbi:MAG: cell wall hydrolase [Hyphomicrobiales bacterium]
MSKPFRADYPGETPFRDETFEDFAGLEAANPRTRATHPAIKAIPFVLAGVLLAASVAVVGTYLGQNQSAQQTAYAGSAAIASPGVSTVGKSAFHTQTVKLSDQAYAYAYDVSQQVTVSRKGDRVANVTVVHRMPSHKARRSVVRKQIVAKTQRDVVITPASANPNRPISTSVLTPSIRKLESHWRRGRNARKKAFSKRSVSRNEHYCMAKAIYFEARSESRAGQLAVANVVMNRKRSKNFPNTICAVVYENRSKNKLSGCQFSFTCDGRDDKPRRGRQWEKSKKLATKVMKGHRGTRVVNSSVLHYHADYVRPKWSYAMRRLTKIGRHIFYTGS